MPGCKATMSLSSANNLNMLELELILFNKVTDHAGDNIVNFVLSAVLYFEFWSYTEQK